MRAAHALRCTAWQRRACAVCVQVGRPVLTGAGPPYRLTPFSVLAASSQLAAERAARDEGAVGPGAGDGEGGAGDGVGAVHAVPGALLSAHGQDVRQLCGIRVARCGRRWPGVVLRLEHPWEGHKEHERGTKSKIACHASKRLTRITFLGQLPSSSHSTAHIASEPQRSTSRQPSHSNHGAAAKGPCVPRRGIATQDNCRGHRRDRLPVRCVRS